MNGKNIEEIEDRLEVLEQMKKHLERAKIQIPSGESGCYFCNIEDSIEDVLNLINCDLEDNEERLRAIYKEAI